MVQKALEMKIFKQSLVHQNEKSQNTFPKIFLLLTFLLRLYLIVLTIIRGSSQENSKKKIICFLSLQGTAFVDFLIDDEAKKWFPSSS